MRFLKEREQIVEYGKKMSAAGLSKGTSGNLSIYIPSEKLMLISPSGIGYFETLPEDVVVMDLDGNVVEGTCKPSSEFGLHSAFYKMRSDVQAVVHTHSTYCTTFACMRRPIEAVHYVIANAATSEVKCSDYATFGTEELAENVIKTCGNANAVLLANHGLVTCGPSMAKAFGLASNMEFVAEMQWRAMSVGTPAVLTEDEIANVMERFKSYGQPKKVQEAGAAGGY
jgi:L-fuculose-phosphate aldolase